LQSEVVEQAPHLPPLHWPKPQSEVVEQPPHWPPLHLLWGQSELVEQLLAATRIPSTVDTATKRGLSIGTAEELVARNSTPTRAQATLRIVTTRIMVPSCLGW